MNRDELDAFFARADDVLTDWRGSDDAMFARKADAEAELAAADSYYVQDARVPMSRPGLLSTLAQIGEEMARMFNAMPTSSQLLRELIPALADALAGSSQSHPTDADNLRDRALQLRRHRNTGPVRRFGLDGRYRQART